MLQKVLLSGIEVYNAPDVERELAALEVAMKMEQTTTLKSINDYDQQIVALKQDNKALSISNEVLREHTSALKAENETYKEYCKIPASRL